MGNLKLANQKWQPFWLENLVNILPGVRLIKSDHTPGKRPFIGATDNTNGITAFVDNSNSSLDCNVLGVNYNGSVVESFYHPYECIFTDDVKRLHIKHAEGRNKYIYLFLITCILQQKAKYAYGYKFNEARMKRQKIMLPVDYHGNPNWQFMEEYSRQEQSKQIKDLLNCLEQKNQTQPSNLNGLESVTWGDFHVGELFVFENKPSKGLNHLKKVGQAGLSYIGATNNNNGVIAFVEDVSVLKYKGNCIAFIRNGEGSMGYAVYKQEDFIATQDISVGYNPNLNRYTGMFITTISDRVRGKYNFGYKRNLNRLKKEILQLPIDPTGFPDWAFMDLFMKNLELEKTKNILNYFFSQLEV